VTPEWTDIIGIVHYENPSLGFLEHEFCTTCEFYPDDTRIRVRHIYDEKEGWLVGVMHHPCEHYEYGKVTDYQLILYDDGYIRGAYIDKLIQI
jgi:hypothetical protein